MLNFLLILFNIFFVTYCYLIYLKFHKNFALPKMAVHDALQLWQLLYNFFSCLLFHLQQAFLTTHIHTYNNIPSSPYLSVRLPSDGDVAAFRTQKRFVSSFQIMKIFIYKHININAVLCCAMRVAVCHPRTEMHTIALKSFNDFWHFTIVGSLRKKTMKKINKFKIFCRLNEKYWQRRRKDVALVNWN